MYLAHRQLLYPRVASLSDSSPSGSSVPRAPGEQGRSDFCPTLQIRYAIGPIPDPSCARLFTVSSDCALWPCSPRSGGPRLRKAT